MGANHLHDLAAIIDDLEAKGRLARVKSEVDLRHELAGIAAKLEGGPRAVLFEKAKGHRFPVFTGLYWNRGLLADLMRREERALPQFVSGCIKKWQREPLDPVVVKSGPVLEVTEKDVDLGKIPVPVHALKDGGPYFDAAVVIAKDPETGIRNASIQRFQVAGRNLLHVNIDAGRHLEAYLEKAKRLGRSLWITLNCGVGPGLHFAAAVPAEAAPIDRDELGIASEFHGAPLELVPGTESDVEMVAHAMWALECEIVPGQSAPEGPFAEVTNYYAKVEPRPVVHVRRVHRRERPVFHTILSGVEVWNSVGLLGEANVLALLQQQVPGVRDVYFSHGGGGFYHAVVQIEQRRAGWSKQAMLAAFAAFPPLKMVTVVDDDVNIHSAEDVEWAMATRLDPAAGIVTIGKAFGHGLNPSFPDYLGPKVGFDATQPFPKRPEYERVAYKDVALEAYDIAEPELKATAKPAPRTAAAAAPPASPMAAPVKSGDYDTDRIWQRELGEWQKGRGQNAGAPAKPSTGSDWDETRWLRRELEDMKRGAEAKPSATFKASAPAPARPAPPPRAETSAPRITNDWDENRWWKRALEEMKAETKGAAKPAALPKPPAAPKAGAPAPARPAPRTEATAPRAPSGASSDWDENRWWKRELEELKREGQGKKPSASAGAPKPPPARPATPARVAAATKPEPMRAADSRATDDDEGGFFRGGAM